MDIAEYKKLMTDMFVGNETVREKYGLTAGQLFDDVFSAVSIENILFANMATAMYTMQELFEQFKRDVAVEVDNLMPGTANWYTYMAKRFQYGMSPVPETDYYDNTGKTDDEIEAMRVVKYAAAVESKYENILYIKVCTGESGSRHPLSADQLTAFKNYMDLISFAGVYIVIINDEPDEMRLVIDVYYDQMVLDSAGRRLDGTGESVVQDAVRNYLNNLPFNGTYTNQGLVDQLQKIDGVEIAELKEASSRYGDYVNFTYIDAFEVSNAGYYSISDALLIIKFIPNE